MNALTIVGIVLVVAGVMGAGVSFSADYTGLNLTQDNKDYKEFGVVQMAGCAGGAVMAIAGGVLIVVSLLKKKEEEPVQEVSAPLVIPPQFQERPPAAQQQAPAGQPRAPAYSAGGHQIPVRGPAHKAPAQQAPPAGAPNMPAAQPDGLAVAPELTAEVPDIAIPSDDTATTQPPTAEAPHHEESDADYPTLGAEGLDSLDELEKGLDMDILSKGSCPGCGDPVTPGSKSCPTCGEPFA